ncbi:MAG: TonB-dependent receptor [Bdellovibrionota bacterium]
MLLLQALCFFLFPTVGLAIESVRVVGIVQERGTKKPLTGVNIYLLPDHTKAVTDEKGHFQIDHFPEGPVQWTIRLSGYQNFDQADVQKADQPNPPRYLYIEKLSYQDYETTVLAQAEKRDEKTKTVAAEDFKAAGTGNDPIKAIQNLPGATTPSFFTPSVLIEGSAPEDTRYLIDGVPVPTIFHFGGFATVVQSDVLGRVDFLTAGYGPEYGEALGGQVDAWTISPAHDRLQGFAFGDIFNVGGMIEGPASKDSSFLFAARTGYVGAAVAAFNQQNSLFNLTTIPTFSDGTFIYQAELTPTDTLKLVNVGSYDSLGLTLIDTIPQKLSQSTGYFRVIPEYEHRWGKITSLRASVGFGRDWIFLQNPGFNYHEDSTILTSRIEVENKTTPVWKNIWGFEDTLTLPNTNFFLPEITGKGVSQGISSYWTEDFAPYWRVILHPDDAAWTLTPGFRGDYYSINNEFVPQPRLGVRYEITKSLALRTSGGLYSQAPADQLLDPAYGNSTLQSEKAWHLTLGAEKDFRGGTPRGFQLSGDGFYKFFEQLIVPSKVAGVHFDNSGFGRAFGLEALLRADFGDFHGMASYMISRTTRASATLPETLSGYDQTHTFTALGSYMLPKNWKISGRVRLQSPAAYTPILGGVVYDIYLPEPGSFLSQRLPPAPMFQLDLRADKRWVFDRWILTMYLDFQNVTFSAASDGSMLLPIVPTLGLRADI